MKGRELRRWRERQFLSQAALASLLDVHVNTIANWENNRSRVPGAMHLTLEAIEQQRARLVRELNRKKEELAARRRLKMAEQHPAHYLKLVENAAKARAARGQPR